MTSFADNGRLDGGPPAGDDTKSRRPRVHVAILGARGHYAVPKLLHQAGMLGRFFTDVYAGTTPWLMRLVRTLPAALRPRSAQRFLGRFDSDLPRDRVASFGIVGASYLWKQQRARDPRSLERAHATAARRFNTHIIRRGVPDADVIYGCNGASLELFEYARDRGLTCVLEQTIVPQAIGESLLREEAARWREWELEPQHDEDGPLAARERREWELADLVIAGSSFVLNALRRCGVSENKCRVVPYGIPLDRFRASLRRGSTNLRVLFVGEVGLRKGIPYLLEALRFLDSPLIVARAAGRVGLSTSRLNSYRDLVTFLGPVPRVEMHGLFQWADVLVLPSICEGSALAAYEALVSGVPVVATPNAGAPIRDGVDGILVPIRDAQALAGAFERFLKDRELLRFCSQNAVANRDHLGLNAYGRRLTRAIQDTVDPR